MPLSYFPFLLCLLCGLSSDGVSAMKSPNVTVDGMNRFVRINALPVTVDLDAPITVGQLVRFSGRFNLDFSHFSIYLTQNHGQGNEYMPFHMNIHNHGTAVLNTMQDGVWGTETHFQHYYTSGQKFAIHIRCQQYKFEIYLNHIMMYEISHQLPLDRIKQISMFGDATMDSVEWGGGPIHTPFLNTYEGRVVVTGVATDDFELGFVDVNAEKPFYLNARFSQSKVVANSLKYLVWEREETASVSFPFQKGEMFEITILNVPGELVVEHNGLPLITFKHRSDDPRGAYTTIYVGELHELWNVVWN
ncbi:hypothetical protein QR680_004734 [Steinernema hermaphroditum]|uniref:Galectin n=1 Tax=Steinernema hermaphroditum TaxID=289476 RepID=A0AA39HRV8_9BILA|nr:hypothetical protein QR680_004734 [Steinernema hermaphroditum]